MSKIRTSLSWGTAPLRVGVPDPEGKAIEIQSRRAVAMVVGMLAVGSFGCSAKAQNQTYDPVPLGMLSSDAPFYDDGQTVIYQVKRPISLPILAPTNGDLATLAKTPTPPYTHAPWITKNDVKVQVSWTISNLDTDPHNVEVLLDPWNEFARYVPGVNVGEEETVPDLSGIDLLIRVQGMERQSSTFTYDDMDEVATDLATVQEILVDNPPPTTPPVAGSTDQGAGVNGMINHAFDVHNRSNDNDRLINAYIPKTIAGLVGFDLGLRLHEKGSVAIEVQVEVVDVAGNRVKADAPLKIDGTMWIKPATNISAPAGNVR